MDVARCHPSTVSQTVTLLEEESIISLRTALVNDDGDVVAFRLMPAWLDSSIPKKRGSAPKGRDWVFCDQCLLYRHMRSAAEELQLVRSFPSDLQDIRPIRFEETPQLKLAWADSGNSVALYLNGEPWAFIDEATHKGHSKGIIKPPINPNLPAIGHQWDQELFEKLFETNG
jgi:hypothetical protein